MGLTTSALLRFGGMSGMDDPRILALEREPLPEAKRLVLLWRPECECVGLGWFDIIREERPCPDPIPKPPRLDVTVAYDTCDFARIVFGADAIAVLYLFNTSQFTDDATLHVAILSSCVAYARLFEASEGVITGDDSPMFPAFFEGKSYDACLQEAINAGQREVSSPPEIHEIVTWEDLSEVIMVRGYWRFYPPRV